MRCKDADRLMMKYIDQDITTDEAKTLNGHILSCSLCKESFFIYDKIIVEVDTSEFEAPEGFSDSVMEMVSDIPIGCRDNCFIIPDRLRGIAGISFATLLSVGILLINFRELIMGYLIENPEYSRFTDRIIPINTHINENIEIVRTASGNVFNHIDMVIANTGWMLSGSFLVLMVVQVYIIRRRRKINKR